MKKSTEAAKTAHSRRPLEASLPKKQFQLLYRERDPEQPYENIIFMKSKKCDHPLKHDPLPKRKSRQQPVQQLKDMVAQLERQLDNKRQRTSKDTGKLLAQKGEGKYLQAKSPTSAKDLFKNKQIKETFHSKASSRWNKYRKQEGLVGSNNKYKNMLSPSRANAKPKDDTLSSKFLRSTQETFRKEKTRPSRQNMQNLPFSTEPEEYILLENNFLELTNEDVSLLQLKITSNKAMPEIKPFQNPKSSSSKRCSVQESPSMQQSQSCVVKEISQYQPEMDCEPQMEAQLMDEEEDVSDDASLSVDEMRVMELFMLSKVKLIQRWWRQMLSKKQKPLDPVVFRKCNEDFQESMLFLHSSEVSPIKMIEQPHADRKDEVQERPDPLRLRQQAAEHQLKTHLQLLQQLLEDGRIGNDIYLEKKALIEARYQHELQQVQQLQRIMSENTQRAYQMTIKTQQDRTKLQSITQLDHHTLDMIFGKDFAIPSPPTLPSTYEMMIVNRQKSTGCHFDQEEKTKPSIYQKHSEQDYSEDFQEQQEEGEGDDNLDEYNANFSQLLDQYKSRQQVTVEIDRRAAVQMGALLEDVPEEVRAGRMGIDTSLNSIHRFVLSFFKFYIFYYRDEFLRLINMPYGYSPSRRLAFMHGYEMDDEPEEDDSGVIYGLEAVISDQILDEFYQKVYNVSGGMSQVQQANLQFERVHNRALLDCFNEGLNHFRPYFFANGPSYPWSTSEKALTFYYIAEENIQEVFEKTQFKLLRWASSLCGIMPNSHTTPCPNAAALPAEQALELYRSTTHPDLVETRQERLTKQERTEITEGNHEWSSFEDQATMLRLECADHVFSKLVEELARHLLPTTICNLVTFDFFDGLSEEESDGCDDGRA